MMAIRSENIALPILGALLPEVFSVRLDSTVSNIPVNNLSIDSRAIDKGDVFVALQGVNLHGEVFIPVAIKQCAVAILCGVSEGDFRVEYRDMTPVIFIPALEKYLSEIAGNFYHHPTKKVPVIGITGTNGKTSCAQIYAQLSAFNNSAVGVIGTMGYGACRPSSSSQAKHGQRGCSEPGYSLSLVSTGMTTPDAITTQSICDELLHSNKVSNALGLESVVMEISSHGLEQGRASAIDINSAIFTNLTHDHLDYHGDMVAYGNAKAKLFEMPSLSVAIVNLDDEFSNVLTKRIASTVRVINYSIDNPKADLYLANIRYGNSQLLADLYCNNQVYSLSTPLIGRFNLSNLLAVLAVFSEQEDFTEVVSSAQYLQPISGRMESVPNRLGVQVIVDFAHTPDALENVLQAVSEYVEGDVYCVFGCGGDRDQSKRPLMAAIAERYANHVVVTNDNPRTENAAEIIEQIEQGFSVHKHHIIEDRETAIRFAIQQAKVGDMIVVAGKGHEAYQQIGNKKISFSDQKVAHAALKDREVSDD
ncbi:MAG: UDP-N-acetylmuramoyl-L-alanyl-D-glutamate--2,6-diaminopimelate ligase [Candidatus Endobugula sp.]|jgi:UDP-N-acetylmuramoyl-L-alanyl-D-glutamate--2,6-diaminopimelate ligase